MVHQPHGRSKSNKQPNVAQDRALGNEQILYNFFCQDLCLMDVTFDVDFASGNLFFFVLLW
jgi:hypothetical protein